MPSFAKASTRAERAVTAAISLGSARHENKADGQIHSVGTARAYESALKQVAEWDRNNGNRGLERFDNARAEAYLTERAEYVSQSTLDRDRQALQILPGVGKLDRVQSEYDKPGLADTGRAYTSAQVMAVTEAMSQKNALATEVAHAAGLRAHELLTLRPVGEQPASGHREWRADRFSGREGQVYTVVGKGGLVREVMLPTQLSTRLEQVRLDTPVTVIDRGIPYQQHYRIGGGQAWSASFSRASEKELGYSTGAHGLRHSYAQDRMEELQSSGMEYQSALGAVSQEMGHFRPDITEVYLR